MFVEVTLAQFCIQLILPEQLQCQSQMLFMLFLIIRIEENVIKVKRTNLSKYLLKTLFIRHINVAVAFVSPNGTTTKS